MSVCECMHASRFCVCVCLRVCVCVCVRASRVDHLRARDVTEVVTTLRDERSLGCLHRGLRDELGGVPWVGSVWAIYARPGLGEPSMHYLECE